MNCKVCGSQVVFIFTKKLLERYLISYYQCLNCGLIQTEKPYWLKEAYSSPIIDSDTGVISRNIKLSKITALINLFFLGKKSKVLDYGGGYGLMTRMLRDIGIDAYWTDKYAGNIFARGFESQKGKTYDMVTAFELFEHLENPLSEIKSVIKKYKPKILLFSTMLHSGNPPKDWWYFATDGGQHIVLYTKKSLDIFAKNLGLKFSTNGWNVHIFSERKIPNLFLALISLLWPVSFFILPIFYRGKTFSDNMKISFSK